MEFEKVVYIGHPYGGLKENEEEVAIIINKLIEIYPNYLFISPIHSFSYCYHTVDYFTGIEMCLNLLRNCDEAWFYGDYSKSRGCNTEIGFCYGHGIPFVIKSKKGIGL